MGGGRRLFSIALVALIATATLSLVPATAAQADVTVTTPEALQAELAAPTDVIQLGADIAADATTPLIVGTGTTATLDLNGHDLEITTSGTGIAVTQATLVIRDGAGGGTLTTTSGINGIAGGTATIRIEGGKIEATGSTVGIGGSSNPTVEISGGTVIAAGGSGAGIGASFDTTGGGSVLVSGGDVTASSNRGAGVGGGEASYGTDVTITGGTVTASSWVGAGIGGGFDGRTGTVTISGGDVTSTVDVHFSAGSAIGPGFTGIPGAVVLSGGVVRADAGGAFPAIGGTTITMSGGDVAAFGRGGAAVGFDASTVIELRGGHLIADALFHEAAAILGASATLYGTASPASTATDGGDGITTSAVDYTFAPGPPGVTFTATSRAATALGVPANAEVQFQLAATFDAAGGTPSPPDQIVDWGDTATEPAVTRAGFVFDGWRVDTAAGAEWDFSDPVTEPLHLVAAWVAEPPTISGNPPDGTVGVPYSYAMTVGGADSTVTLFDGTLPPGVSVNSAGVISGTPLTTGTFYATLRATNAGGTADQPVAITIVVPVFQTVTFDAAGGTPEPADQFVPTGDTATQPAAPTRSGYAFDGWRVGAATGAVWDFADPVTGPLDLVAAWIELPTITGPATADGTSGDAFTYAPTVTGLGVTVTDDGDLPAGLSLNPSTGEITGTPTETGVFEVTLTATNAGGWAEHAVMITIAHGAAVSFTATASDMTPTQGDTITITVTASDAYGNTWDASSSATITSSVASDVIVGTTVRFRHASPHVLTVTLPSLAAQQLVVDVTPAGGGGDGSGELGETGGGGAGLALPIALLAILGGTGLVLLRRRAAA